MTMTRLILHTELGNFMELNFLEKIIFLIFYCWCHKNVDRSSAAFLKLF